MSIIFRAFIVGGLLLASSVGTWADSRVVWSLGENAALLAEAMVHKEQVSKVSSDESATVELLHRHHIDMRAEGVVQTVEEMYFYPTLESIRDGGVDAIVWDISRERLEITESVVIQPDGAINRFDPTTATIIDTNSYDVVTDKKRVVLQLPGLTPGSISIMSYRIHSDNPEEFFLEEFLTTTLPRRFVEHLITWRGVPPRWANGSEHLRCEESPGKVRCIGRDLPVAKLDIKVQYRDILPTFKVAVQATWSDVIANMNRKIASAVADAGTADGVIRELREAPSPLHRAHDLASRQIRYVSFSEGEHSHAPHAIHDTLRNRYGDCKDKSTLLFALLRKLGYNAYPVLVATKRSDPSGLSIPSVGYFDHMVVCAIINNGERCFDPTDAYTSPLYTPSFIQGKVRLNLIAGSEPSTIPQQIYRWEFQVKNELTFVSDGSQTEVLERTLRGAYASWFRLQLGGLDATDRGKWLQEEYRRTVTEGVKSAFTVTGLDELARPVVIRAHSTFPVFLDPDSALNYADTSYWMVKFLQDQRIANEHYPYAFQGLKLMSQHRFVEAGVWKIQESGATFRYATKFGTLYRRYQREAGVIVVDTILTMPSAEIPVEQFEAFNRFLDLVLADTRIRLWGKRRHR